MLDNSGIFAFDIDFDNNGKRSFLEVFVKYNTDGTHYYYCVVDDKDEYTFGKRDDGIWVDMKSGKSDLADVVGKIIEKELSFDHKFHSHDR
jgi:hypothetical protein